jgi:hypothetical protein
MTKAPVHTDHSEHEQRGAAEHEAAGETKAGVEASAGTPPPGGAWPTPPSLKEPRHPGEFIISEANGSRSRGAVTIGASQTIVPGTVLTNTAGTYTAHDPAGAGTADAVAMYGCVTGAGGSAQITAIVGEAEVNGNTMTWAAGITDPQRLTAIGQLNSKQIHVLY